MNDRIKNQERLETTTDLLASGTLAPVQNMLENLNIAEITLLLESAPPKKRKAIWRLIPLEDEAEVLQELNQDVQAEIIKLMDERELQATARSAAETLETDDLVDLLQDLTENKIKNYILDALDITNRALVEKILSYPEDSAGGAMNTDAILVPHDISIALATEYLQRLGELPEQTDCLFVVDKNQKFLGTLPLTKLLTNQSSTLIKDVMHKDSHEYYLSASASAEQIGVFFAKNDLLSVAVVDDKNKILGRITADDVVSIVKEQGEHNYLGASGLDEEIDTFAPVKQSVQKRIVWLLITLGLAYVTTMIIGLFEPTIEKILALAILMPVTSTIGGAAGGQTFTLVLRGMVLQQVGRSNFRWLLNREIIVSIINGFVLAFVIALVTQFRFQNYYLSLIIFISILTNLCLAAILGCTLPMLLKRFNIDPAISGNIIVSTVTDIMGYFVFLGLATLIFATN